MEVFVKFLLCTFLECMNLNFEDLLTQAQILESHVSYLNCITKFIELMYSS